MFFLLTKYLFYRMEICPMHCIRYKYGYNNFSSYALCLVMYKKKRLKNQNKIKGIIMCMFLNGVIEVVKTNSCVGQNRYTVMEFVSL